MELELSWCYHRIQNSVPVHLLVSGINEIAREHFNHNVEIRSWKMSKCKNLGLTTGSEHLQPCSYGGVFPVCSG